MKAYIAINVAFLCALFSLMILGNMGFALLLGWQVQHGAWVWVMFGLAVVANVAGFIVPFSIADHAIRFGRPRA